MSVTGWSLVRFLHVLAAMAWVGGQLLLTLVVLPALRQNVEQPLRARLASTVGMRFAVIANAWLLPLLVMTGVALALHRGVTFATLDAPGYGRLLSVKLVLVVVSVALATVHGIVARKRPRQARRLAVAGLVSSIGIVVFATALVP